MTIETLTQLGRTHYIERLYITDSTYIDFQDALTIRPMRWYEMQRERKTWTGSNWITTKQKTIYTWLCFLKQKLMTLMFVTGQYIKLQCTGSVPVTKSNPSCKTKSDLITNYSLLSADPNKRSDDKGIQYDNKLNNSR